MQKTPRELMNEIWTMLKGNPKAICFVYAFLMGMTGGDAYEKSR